jgi:hypothetical protein
MQRLIHTYMQQVSALHDKVKQVGAKGCGRGQGGALISHHAAVGAAQRAASVSTAWQTAAGA